MVHRTHAYVSYRLLDLSFGVMRENESDDGSLIG